MYNRDTGLSNSHDVNILLRNSDVLKGRFVYNDSVIWNYFPDEIRMGTDVIDVEIYKLPLYFMPHFG